MGTCSLYFKIPISNLPSFDGLLVDQGEDFRQLSAQHLADLDRLVERDLERQRDAADRLAGRLQVRGRLADEAWNGEWPP